MAVSRPYSERELGRIRGAFGWRAEQSACRCGGPRHQPPARSCLDCHVNTLHARAITARRTSRFLYMLSAVKTASSRTAAGSDPGLAPADTSDKLIAAAERLFAAHGYTNVSVRSIAAAAGVNWSLVGYYFRGKEGLLSEVYRRHCRSLNAERLKLLAQAREQGLPLER